MLEGHRRARARTVCSAVIVLLGAIGMSGCGRASAASDLQQAESFVKALNEKRVDRMLELSGLPFFFKNQEWTNATDGSGFVLGGSSEKIAHNSDELRALFTDITKGVQVEGTKANPEPPPQRDLIETHVKSASAQWAPLRILVFLRGTGDVEHTALVGVEPARRKVTAFYVN